MILRAALVIGAGLLAAAGQPHGDNSPWGSCQAQSIGSGAAAPGIISGTVFADVHAAGIRAGNEPGLANVRVMLFGTSSGAGFYFTTATDTRGQYAFQGSLIADGATYTVTTGGYPSPALVPTSYHPLHTYYTATNGKDGNPGTVDRPFPSIDRGLIALHAGDLLLVGGGIYQETLSSHVPGGTSWEQPVVVKSYPGQRAVIRPAPATVHMTLPVINITYPWQRYIVFDALTIDAVGAGYGIKIQAASDSLPNVDHIRLINCEIMNSAGQGVFVGDGQDSNEFINDQVHDNGTTRFCHGFYVGSCRNLVRGCDIYRNAGWGVHFYGGTDRDNVITANRSHDNNHAQKDGPGFGIYSGPGNLLSNNIAWGNHDGLDIAYDGTNTRVYNNLFFDNRGAAVNNDASGPGTIFKNNILFRNHGGLGGTYSARVVKSNNIVESNPRFRNPAALDFHLLGDSPAVGSGAPLAEVPADFDGVARPQGAAPDIGPYQYTDRDWLPTTALASHVYRAGQSVTLDIGFTRKGLAAEER
jgi:parallel beta-helix repeat protein